MIKKYGLGNSLVLVYDSEKGVICLPKLVIHSSPGYVFEWGGEKLRSFCLCYPCFNYLGLDIELISSKLNNFLFSEVDLSFVLYIHGHEVCEQLKYRLAGTVQVEEFHGHF
jgi:hypothetical protein